MLDNDSLFPVPWILAVVALPIVGLLLAKPRAASAGSDAASDSAPGARPPGSSRPPPAASSPTPGPRLRVNPVGARVTGQTQGAIYEVVAAPTEAVADVVLKVIAYPLRPQSVGATFPVSATMNKWGPNHPVIRQLAAML